MIIVALLLAMPASIETGSLRIQSLDARQVCGTRRTGPSGPELVNDRGVVLVDAAIMTDAERMSPSHVMDGARYCVSLEHRATGPRVTSITYAAPFEPMGR